MKWFIAYVALATSIAIGLVSAGPYSKYHELSSRGVETSGSIIETSCANHQTFSFRFEALGKSYSRSGASGMAKPCSELTIGDQVQVFYLPSDPTLNISGNPKYLLRNEHVSIGLVALLGPAFISGVLAWRNRRNARQSAVCPVQDRQQTNS